MKTTTVSMFVLVVSTLLLAACGPQPTQAPPAASPSAPTRTPAGSGGGDYGYGASPTTASPSAAAASVMVGDQSVAGGSVTVQEARLDRPGWIVIHIEADGKPGPVIGYAAIPAGTSRDVRVSIEASKATPALFAMLHYDEGTSGAYEFPGADVPVKVGEQIVMMRFNAAAAGSTIIEVGQKEGLGAFLVDSQGRTLYLFLADTPTRSACSGGCAENWPPLLSGGAVQAGEGVQASKLGSLTRGDGTTQVTYNGHPLYYFAGDARAGDTNGQGIGGKWYVVSPAGEPLQ